MLKKKKSCLSQYSSLKLLDCADNVASVGVIAADTSHLLPGVFFLSLSRSFMYIYTLLRNVILKQLITKQQLIVDFSGGLTFRVQP